MGTISLTTDNTIADFLKQIETIDVIQNLQQMTFCFCLSTELWKKYSEMGPIIDSSKFKRIKFFSEDGTLSEEVKTVPKKGGIYIYVIENPIIPQTGKYIMYVGQSKELATSNLNQRLHSHYYQYKKGEENERLEKVFDNWKEYVYVLYISVTDNEKIDLIENQLILALTPPCNKKYPSVPVRRKLSSFQYT